MMIPLTERQYRTLAKLVYMGDWVVNAWRSEGLVKETEDLLSYVLSFAKDFDAEEIAEPGPKKGQLWPSAVLDEEGSDHLDEFEEAIFWDMLVDKLGARDMTRDFTVEAMEGMSQEQRIRECIARESVWDREFAAHGLERIAVDGDPVPPEE